MSLGQSNMFATNKRSQMLGHATSAMRQFNLPGNKASAAPPAAAPPTNHTASSQSGGDVPIKVKIEALEIAIGALSERLGDLAEQSTTPSETDSGNADLVQLKSQVSALDQSVAELRSEVQQCMTACPASSEASAAEQVDIMATMAVATQMVHATVTEATTWVYDNVTGDPQEDINDSPSRVLSAHSRVRLVFPQFKHTNGSIYMGAVWVDPVSMQVNTGWVCLIDESVNEPRLCDFTV